MPDDRTRIAYAHQTPFREVWIGLSAASRSPVLAYWIEKADRDPWAFDQLRELGAELLENGMTPPPPLDSFLAGILRGREPPTRWRSNVRRDLGIAALVEIATSRLDMSQRQACREIGAALRMSPEAVESARRRGNRV